ncbi:hypothetical protein [Luteimonas fraxinea]|uniref:Uncharacterized protein n=1 Tax=Luteimonas fraxinea TaxID=2901869 RepID=A0ABS8UB00_9GAMM|nr:hypothetical protein [Luteimonas fraxinea]MCD9096157.1 hypothetical protein [Luteimonas fraxinea]
MKAIAHFAAKGQRFAAQGGTPTTFHAVFAGIPFPMWRAAWRAFTGQWRASSNPAPKWIQAMQKRARRGGAA